MVFQNLQESYRDYVIMEGNAVRQVVRQRDMHYSILCNLNDKSMTFWRKKVKGVAWKEIPQEGEVKYDIVDLSPEGKRWEGNVKDGKPFGFGCFYSEDNNLEYQGFVYDGNKVCFGIEYHEGLGTVKSFEGTLVDGIKHGAGVLYDRKGDVIYGGGFTENAPFLFPYIIIEESKVFSEISIFIVDIVIIDNSCSKLTSCSFSCYPFLRSIKIGKECFLQVSEFLLNRCFCLQSITIDRGSFPCKAENTSFHISHCPALVDLQISPSCFESFKTVCIEGIIKKEYSSIDLTSLQVLDIGYKAFHYCKHFELKGIVNLFCII